MSARVVAVIQARMGSTRLPGKVLLPLGSRSVLSWVVRAARAAPTVDEVVVATSTSVLDDEIVQACDEMQVASVRGDEIDVLSRFVLAATSTQADAVVRLTSDCPLLDPRLIDQVVGLWRADPELDYVSTALIRTLPRGLDVELATRQALDHADGTATGHDRIHVTSSLYHEQSAARRAGLVVAPSSADLRVTLDVEPDYALLLALVGLLPDGPPSWRSVVSTLRSNPRLAAINAAVEQKELAEG